MKTATAKTTKRIAVIGSGISGISAAWFLGQQHEVVLFEKNERLGGHTHTVDLFVDQEKVSVDTGFIVFNRPNYPNLTAMFQYLGIKTVDTEMSFSVSVDRGKIEYSGSNLNMMFAQRRNLFSRRHWAMIAEILRFNKQAKSDLAKGDFAEISLKEYLDNHHFSETMREYYLLPMAAAIWSCPLTTMQDFPIQSFLQFFENHGLLNIEDRPQWESVFGGSKNYLDAIMQLQMFEVRLNSKVREVSKTEHGLVLQTESGATEIFDDIVFASHADETYAMLDESLQQSHQLLTNFQYQKNIAYLHRDKELMPKRKLAWSAWNYLRDTDNTDQPVAVTYWMNRLQKLPTDTPLLVTLNPSQPPKADLTDKTITYHHPVFDDKAIAAQKAMHSIQGQDNLWFCGSYCGYGFHEDGLTSSVNLAQLWEIDLPWRSPENSAVEAGREAV